jgi:hypothetical protein
MKHNFIKNSIRIGTYNIRNTTGNKNNNHNNYINNNKK